MSTSFINDPLWYKDAVIYELHVRSFFDANNDGFGDFQGMRQKLPYLESLGVNTLWLLPFLESPLQDDGYDTSDYYNILPVHGTLDDFKAFLDEAHQRGMRVITELVLNHTSDQHPWFQEARDSASPRHDWYVWSDTTERYKEARIIFTDTEVSNWTWDRKAGKYYWHRFFSHQPDLNYDNPDVRRAMKEVMFYWFDLGVDGLRLDAVPYLYEREGTNCENLPETIRYISELRQAIEERYGPGRVLLAEANQWPEDTLPYFDGGKGVQMAFNFPVMPRMYMALRRESRRPLVSMLELTQDIPEPCQWAIFLRNHDELTLEMVTDEERDYMYHEYATDSRFRINVGIRRRLAPLLGHERRRIELMNALLLTLPGSPVIYYGDEIGMGDDPFLGDRNGVRTPMQWSPDKNGGFSRAPHHRLFMPSIGHGPYSYSFINVEDAENDPHSLLNFMRRLLALRRQFVHVLGRGTLKVLPVENQSVLAFIREYEGERIFVIVNLSRFSQSAFLPVTDDLKGCVPTELFSKTPFPPFADTPYHFLLGPHGFYWFSLQSQEMVDSLLAEGPEAIEHGEGLPILDVSEGLHNLLVRTMASGNGIEQIQALLPRFVGRQRWFGSKDQAIEKVTILDAVRLRATPVPVYLTVLEVYLPTGREQYLLPLMLGYGEDAEAVFQQRPTAALAWVQSPEGRGLLFDATAGPLFWTSLFSWWQSGSKGRSLLGTYASSLSDPARTTEITDARVLSGEQSNSSAILGGRYFAKLYRRLETGANPETELLEHLTAAGFPFIPRLHGQIAFQRGETRTTIGILQQALDVESDGWVHALDMMKRFLDRVAGAAPPPDGFPTVYLDPVPVWIEEVAPEMLSLARLLGVRTAELHRALSRASQPGLSPSEGSPEDMRRLVERVRNEVQETRRMLAESDGVIGHALGDDAWEIGLQRLERLLGYDPPLEKIRIHGDYHLGQVIRSEGEFYILDFEGEPARSMEERRQTDYAFRDVAGMLRSIEYAARAAWHEYRGREASLEGWTDRIVRWCEASFLDAYYRTSGEDRFVMPLPIREPFLWTYLFDKALYEVRYELSHRPDWTWLPLEGLNRLLRIAWQQEKGPEPTRSR